MTASNSTMTSSSSHGRVETLYGYCDYTDDGRPYYVGIGCARRLKIQGRNKKHTNVAHKHGWTRHVEISLRGTYDTIWAQLCEWETQTIRALDTMHRPGHIGCNFTSGGDGIRGFKRIKGEAERLKISQSKKALYADPVARQKLGEAIRRAKAEPDKLQRHAVAQQKRYSDPHERHKAHLANTQRKRVRQLTLSGDVIAEFSSLSYAIQATGVKNIKLVCQGKRSVAGGYRWCYIDGQELPCQPPNSDSSSS